MKTTAATIVDRVNQVLIQEFEVDPAVLRPDAAIIGDLGLDSLDVVDMIVQIEREFGHRIQDEQARALRTLGDVYRYIEQHWTPPTT